VGHLYESFKWQDEGSSSEEAPATSFQVDRNASSKPSGVVFFQERLQESVGVYLYSVVMSGASFVYNFFDEWDAEVISVANKARNAALRVNSQWAQLINQQMHV